MGINIEEGKTTTFIGFELLKLPTQFCVCYRKLGHRMELYDDTLQTTDNIQLEGKVPPPSHATTQPLPLQQGLVLNQSRHTSLPSTHSQTHTAQLSEPRLSSQLDIHGVPPPSHAVGPSIASVA